MPAFKQREPENEFVVLGEEEIAARATWFLWRVTLDNRVS